MTIEDFLEIGRIRAKSPKFEKKWNDAVAVSAEQLETHKNAYASISAGKDSGVLAYVVAEACRLTGKECKLWAYTSDASFPGTEETAQAIADGCGLSIEIERCPFSAYDTLSRKQKQAFGKTGTFYSAVRGYAEDKDLSFVGVRAAESKRRKRAIDVHGQVFHSASMGNVDICYSLAWFRLEDVAAATVKYEIPLHPIYWKQPISTGQNANHEDSFIRLGYATSRDLLKYGTTVFMRLNYPEIYEKVAEVYPEIRNDT